MLRLRIVLSAGIACLIGFSGCGSKEKNEAAPKPKAAEAGKKTEETANDRQTAVGGFAISPFLTAADLAPPSGLKASNAATFKTALQDESLFFLSDPEIDDEESDSCLDTAKVQAKDDSLLVDVTADAKCFAQNEQETVKLESSHLRFIAVLTCKGKDFSAFDGKRVKDLGDDFDKENCSGTTRQKFGQAKIETVQTFEIDGKIVKTKSVSMTSTMTSDGKPCEETETAGKVTFGACVDIYSSTTEVIGADDTLGLNSKSYSKLTGEKLIGDVDAMYYSSGKIEFEMNGWQGTMTYSGAKTKPKWTATDGKTTQSGSFN